MYCRSCGNQLPDDAIFCNGCGTRVQVDEDDATRKGRPTIQFDSNPQLPPTQFSSSPQLPPQQFGNSPQLPSSWQTPTSSQSGQMFPPMTPSQPGLSSGANWPQQEFPLTSPTQPGLPPEPIWPQPGQLILPPVPPQSGMPSGAIWPQSGQMLPPTAPFQSSQPPGATWPQNQQAFPPTTPFQSAQPLGATWPQTQQVFPPTQALLSPSAMQRVLIRIFQPALAGNAIFGVVSGGVLAAVLGPLIVALLLAIAYAIVPYNPALASTALSSEDIADSVLGIVPLHSLFRDSLQLFLVAHGVAISVQSSSIGSANVYTSSGTIGKPLDGLLVLPALLLILGGYIAASTDFQNNVRSSLLRGAAIAVPYTILLLIMSTQVNGSLPSSLTSSSGVNSTLSMDVLSLIIFGLLWGALFGLLGASIKLARGQWRSMIFQYLRANRYSRLTAMITGGLAATGLGIALALIVIYSVMASILPSAPSSLRGFNLGLEYIGSWQTIVLWGITLGPLLATNLLFFSFGAPITLSCNASGTDIGNLQSQCASSVNSFPTFSLFNGPTHPSPWFYVLLAIPAISLFLGGRVSAAMSSARGVGPGAVQGALVAVPFMLFMMLLTLISTVTTSFSGTYSSSVSSTSSATISLSVGVKAFDLLLWALLVSAVFGALGGMYQASTVKMSISKLLFVLAGPLRLLSKPGYFIFDRLGRQSRSSQPTWARSLLYATFLCAFLLAIAAGVAGGIFITFNQTLSLSDIQRIRIILSVLLIALPGLLLLSACASALSTDPSLASRSYTNTASAPAPRF